MIIFREFEHIPFTVEWWDDAGESLLTVYAETWNSIRQHVFNEPVPIIEVHQTVRRMYQGLRDAAFADLYGGKP